MSEKYQVEAIIGLQKDCQDVGEQAAAIALDGDFDIAATIKNSRHDRQTSETTTEWPQIFPSNNMQLLIGAEAVVDAPKALSQMNSLVDEGVTPTIRRVRTVEQRFLLSDKAFLLLPSDTHRDTIAKNASATVAELFGQTEQDYMTLGEARDMTYDELKDHVSSDMQALIDDLRSDRYRLPHDARQRTIGALEATRRSSADNIATAVRDLKPSIEQAKAFMYDSLAQGMRVFVEGPHDVSEDTFLEDVDTELSLDEKLRLLGVTSRHHGFLHGVLNFTPNGGGNLDVTAIEKAIEIYGPDRVIGTRLHAVPSLGEKAVLGFGVYLGKGKVSPTPAHSKSDAFMTLSTPELDTWDEDPRTVSSFDELSDNAQIYVHLIEDRLQRQIHIPEIGTLVDETSAIITPTPVEQMIEEFEPDTPEAPMSQPPIEETIVTPTETAEVLEDDTNEGSSPSDETPRDNPDHGPRNWQ